MSNIDEEIVREYFEGNGFLVRRLGARQSQSRGKASGDEVDLLIYNPRFRPGERKPGLLLFSSELPSIERAVVMVKGWPGSRFGPGTLKSGAKLFRLLEAVLGKRVARPFPETEEAEAMGEHLKIVVLPGLPTAEPFRSRAIELLRSRGIDGIISFRSMLLEILGRLDIDRPRKSTLLEAIELLKNYDLIKDSQLELFGGK